MVEETSQQSRFKLLRQDGLARMQAFPAWYRGKWRSRRWFRLANYLLAAALVGWLLLWVTVIRTLPSADRLLTYQPPLPTMVRGINGEIVSSYARERRVQLRFVDFPEP
ncbi:MAG: penicillin-binding protein, partial [Novosphingobium sp.]|nr:penicillin-binding protein [Novosphingobium sp.]